MATNNAVNISSSGLVKYDGAGTFAGVTVTNHNLLIGASSNGITSVAPSATSGVPVVSAGAAADPAFGTAVVAGGGTGATTLTGVLTGNGTSAVTANAVTNHGVLIGGASNAVSSLAVASTGQILQGNTGADPSFSTATYPSTATSTGTILRADGTNWVATTATYPTTTTANQILFSSATNTISEITTANSSLLKTNGSGVPSMTTTGSVTETSGAFNWPLQPMFRATLSSDATNVTGNATAYTVACNTEAYDQASNYNNATYVFTAPVTGKYHFDATIFMYGIVAATTVDMTIRNSGGTILAQLFRTGGVGLASSGNLCLTGSATIAMTAADTAKLVLTVSGEAGDVVDIQSGTNQTCFSGYLVG